jgi:hypothetical protein
VLQFIHFGPKNQIPLHSRSIAKIMTMRFPLVLFYLVTLTGCNLPQPQAKNHPTTNSLYHWPSVDPRLTLQSFKEGVTTLSDARADLGNYDSIKPNVLYPNENTVI